MENYPGFPGGVRGEDLIERMSKQLDSLGVRVTRACVENISLSARAFLVKSDGGMFSARTLIVATGTLPRSDTLGSRSLLGTKIFNELTEMPLDRIAGKRVIVVGGGDAAFDYALNLLGRGADVIVVSRSKPKCLSLLLARAEAAGAEIVVGANPKSVAGASSGVRLLCQRSDGSVGFTADFVLMACGRVPNLGLLSPALRKKIGKLSIIPRTNVPGLFVAGDVVRGAHRQTGIAVGDGIRAAMLAEEYLRKGAGES